MQPSHDRLLADREQVETQQLRRHLGELRITVSKVHAMRLDFQDLIEHPQGNIAATQALVQELNLLAARLGVSPLPSVKSWVAQTEKKSPTGKVLIPLKE